MILKESVNLTHKSSQILMLFTDGSVNSKTRIGFGAYLLVADPSQAPVSLKADVKLRRFDNTSSTTLELQTLLWALQEYVSHENETRQLIVYTDSQNIINLPARRAALENSNYYSRNNKRLNNFELYQQFYERADKLNFHLIKLSGHKSKNSKSHVDHMFSLVDRESRAALREDSASS
jgi:ribonuclease HI